MTVRNSLGKLWDLLAIKGSVLISASWFTENGAASSVEFGPGAVKLVEFQMNKFLRFVKDESGATAIEYGLIAAAMGLALVTAMPILASAVTGKFTSLAGHISSGT
jgi:pilus assembly protein Flp/PilA